MCPRCRQAARSKAGKESGGRSQGNRTKGPPKRRASFTRWAGTGSAGFSKLGLRQAGTQQTLARPNQIVIVRLTYMGNAAWHIQRRLLSIRCCLMQLRCRVAKGTIDRNALLVGIASARPSGVALKNAMPGHGVEEWPAGRIVGISPLERSLPVLSGYDNNPRYRNRTDANLYRKLDASGSDTWPNFALRNEKNPFRGAAARSRWIPVRSAKAEDRRAKSASGLSWDRWIERAHRKKDLSGDVLLSRRYKVRLTEGGLGELPKCISDRVASLDEKRHMRTGFPLCLSPADGDFDTLLGVVRKVWAP